MFFNIWKGGSAKNWAAFSRFVSIPFLIFEKADKQKIRPGFLRFVSILFLTFENEKKQKIGLGFLGFVVYFFKYLKREPEKNCARFFKICKNTIFNIWKEG